MTSGHRFVTVLRRGLRRRFTVPVAGMAVMLALAAGCSTTDEPEAAGQAENRTSDAEGAVDNDDSSTVSASEPTTSTTSSTTTSSTPTSSPATNSSTTSSTAVTSTETTPTSGVSTTSTTSGDEQPVNQAEAGLRFDYGGIVRYERVDGVAWIWFDRYTFGDLQGVELTEEPRWEMATDWHGGDNVNPRLRSYPLAPGARTLEIDPADFEAACADLNLPWDFIESDVPALLTNGTAPLASLSFDADHRVVLIRDQRGC